MFTVIYCWWKKCVVRGERLLHQDSTISGSNTIRQVGCPPFTHIVWWVTITALLWSDLWSPLIVRLEGDPSLTTQPSLKSIHWICGHVRATYKHLSPHLLWQIVSLKLGKWNMHLQTPFSPPSALLARRSGHLCLLLHLRRLIFLRRWESGSPPPVSPAKTC